MAIVRSGHSTAAAAAMVLLLSSCKSDPAVLAVDLIPQPTASPQYFHGDCFAGWAVHVQIRVRETTGVGVVLDTLTYRLVDQGIQRELGSESLDREALELRYGTMGSRLEGRTSRVLGLSAVSGDRPAGPLEVTGTLAGRDEDGREVSTSFALSAPIVVDDVPPTGNGAGGCSPL